MRVHPGDRERLKALVRDISRESPGYSIVFPFRHSDGRDIWLEETARKRNSIPWAAACVSRA
jgi:hypothetical protein